MHLKIFQYNNHPLNPMEKPYHIYYQESPSEEFVSTLFNGINANAFLNKGLAPIKTFSLSIKTSAGKILGGVNGITYYGCLYVDMLWVDPLVRKQNLGRKLMEEAEKIGKDRACSFSTVNTMDFEALPFYQKLGYIIEFTRCGYDKNSSLFMLRKSL